MTASRRTFVLAACALAGLLARGALAQPAGDDSAGDDTGADDGAADTGDTEQLPRVTASGAAAPAAGGPRTYTIRAGDTLSTVSQEFLGDPQGWPKLWARNPQIANPHWIYPGQVVRLAAEPPKPVAEVEPAAPGPGAPRPVPPRPRLVATRVPARPPAAGPAVPRLRQLGFVDEGTMKATGTIDGSLEEKIMLATGDQAYVKFPAGHPPAPGARFSVYQVDTSDPVREPGSNVVLGYLVRVSGEVVIDEAGQAAKDRAICSGRLMNLVEPVERGYRVGPLLPEARQVAPKRNEVSVTGRIVAALDPGTLIAAQTFVVVNRGRRHGVEVGNRFRVLRQGDGLKRMLGDWDTTDPRFPPHAVAEILAVDVKDETTVGWISHAERELRIGDVADLQRGY